MSNKLPKIDVILARISSPTEFWIKIADHCDNGAFSSNNNNNGKQQTYRDYLRWIKGMSSNQLIILWKKKADEFDGFDLIFQNEPNGSVI